MDSNYLLLGVVILFLIFYFQSKENFENEDKSRECSKGSINKAIYGYQVNMINRGAR